MVFGGKILKNIMKEYFHRNSSSVPDDHLPLQTIYTPSRGFIFYFGIL